MTVSKGELDRRLSEFRHRLSQAGIKVTHQRLEIFRELAQSAEHPDAETIFEAVRRRVPTISLDTVYRTLWLFVDLGVLHTLGPPRDRMRFDANVAPHHHFVCVQCGATHDFFCEECDAFRVPDEVRAMGSVHIKQMEVRGVCVKCQKASSKKIRASRKKEET
jgi:Fur family peroxide stress response transcriptional regulator